MQAGTTRQIVGAVPDADFSRETMGCPGWRVQDVIAHLTTGAQMFHGIALGTISGANWMEERTRRLAENAALTPTELKALYPDADAQLIDTFKGMSPEELQAKRQHPAFGEVPVAHFMGLRISETAIHGWDVASTLDPEARLQGAAVAPVAAQIATVFPSWFLADKIAGLERSYRFTVGAPLNEERMLSISNGKVMWTTDSGDSDATLTLDGGDFLLLISGRLSSERLISTGRAQASGDEATAHELSSLFQAYGGR